MPKPKPSDRASPAASAAAIGAGVRTVERAAGELRRGAPVVIHGGDAVALVLAAEQVSEATLSPFREDAELPAMLVLSAHRAKVLHINPTGDDVVLLPLGPRLAVDMVPDLVDPTGDLANPLRGPFRLAERAPTAADRAAVELCKLARLLPAAVAMALPTDSGTPQAWARARNLVDVGAAEIASYGESAALTLTEVTSARVPLAGAENTRIVAFRPSDGGIEHLAIVVGDPPRAEPVLTRLHSECFTGDLLESLRCDCGQQLRGAIETMAKAGCGVLLYLAQEGRGIGLINKLRAYRLQDQGYDTIEANQRLGFEADERLFLPAAEMLRLLGFKQVRLLTNNPDKVSGLERHGIEVVERVPHAFPPTGHNERYLATKAKRSGHWL